MCEGDGRVVSAGPASQRPGKDAMQNALPIVRRAGVVGLSLLLIAVSAGLAYVAHLTQVTSQKIGDSSPSVLPLIALSVLSAIAGLATLRVALHREREE